MIPKELIDLMRDLNLFPAVVCSSDEKGSLHAAFVTWLYPLDERTLRLGLSAEGTTAWNLTVNPKGVLTLFAPGLALSCYFEARRVKSTIEGLPFPVSVFELSVYRVENALFPGTTVVGIIPFARTGDPVKNAQLDALVLEELKRRD
ncbi:MAG: pyridoxamine 5'-phosphate oxidase [Aquificae bacterium]|nr:pyridoxamine 5'-phosphate oxidase [Aquificota bacterium]